MSVARVQGVEVRAAQHKAAQSLLTPMQDLNDGLTTTVYAAAVGVST